jgi:UDP-glucose 4-epimerase
MCKDIGVFNQNVDHRGIFKILSQTSNRDAVSAMTSDLFLISEMAENPYGNTYILDEDIVRARFECYAIISSLIYHIRKFNVIGIHCIKSIGILDPIRAIWSINSCSIT